MKPPGPVLALDRHLEAGDAAAMDAEHLEEGIPEALGLGILRRLAFPLLGKGNRAGLDLVPAQRHPVPLF